MGETSHHKLMTISYSFLQDNEFLTNTSTTPSPQDKPPTHPITALHPITQPALSPTGDIPRGHRRRDELASTRARFAEGQGDRPRQQASTSLPCSRRRSNRLRPPAGVLLLDLLGRGSRR